MFQPTGGGGSGSPADIVLNRDSNPNVTSNATGYAAFADAAGTAPVDGTGGSPTVSIARSTSSPLEGSATILFTKTAANSQGQGFAYTATLQPDDATKVMTISFDYQITTGTYTGYQTLPSFSDITMWVYDVTNAVMYQVQGFQVDGAVSSTNQYSFQGTWQVPVGCLSARLIWFLGNTGASAFTAKFNNINFGRVPRVQGTIATNPTSWTPTITGFGTPTNVTAYSWRSGPVLKGWVKFTSGTVTGTEARVSLGYNGTNSNVTIDSTAVPSIRIVGSFAYGGNAAISVNVLAEPSVSYVTFGVQASGNAGLTKAVGTDLGNTTAMAFYFEVPITGWGANGTLGQDADTRIVACKYGMGTTYMLPTSIATPYKFNTLGYDTHGAATYGTGVTFTYFVPVAGYYQLALGEYSSNSQAIGSLGDIVRMSALQNGTSFVGNMMANATVASGGQTVQRGIVGTATGYFNAGDKITFYADSSGASYFNQASTAFNYVNISRISGPAQVQAPDAVGAYYIGTPTGTLNNSYNTATLPTKVVDTHNAYSSGTYTVPIAGFYAISGALAMTGSGSNSASCSIYKNGVQITEVFNAFTNNYVTVNITSIYLLAGDTIQLKSNSSQTSPAYIGNNISSWFSISKTGSI